MQSKLNDGHVRNNNFELSLIQIIYFSLDYSNSRQIENLYKSNFQLHLFDFELSRVYYLIIYYKDTQCIYLLVPQLFYILLVIRLSSRV